MLNLQLPTKKASPTPVDEPVAGRIIGGRVRYISLCRMGKNKIQATYKAEGVEGEQEFELALAMKSQPGEEGLLTGLVYAPDVVDDDGNWAEADVIKALAYDFMINGEGIDIFHDNVALDSSRAALVESFIVQKADPRFAGLPMDPTGGWGVVIQLKDEELRAHHRGDTGWQGLSLGGTIVVERDVMPAEKAVGKDDFLRTVRRLTRRALSDAPEATNIRGMHIHVMFPRPGETDFEGRLARPSFDINISGDL